MSFPFRSKHVKNRELSAHGDACSCGCAAPLANNRKYAATLSVPSFEQTLKNDVEKNEDKYLSDIDSVVFSSSSKPSITLDSFILSKIVAQMEANTDFFPKGTDKALAGNCGKRVMPPKLREKILGQDVSFYSVDSSDISKIPQIKNLDDAGTVDIIDYKGSMSYSGVMCCHNVWGCPICARKVSELRKKGLSDLITAHFDRFGAGSITASLFTVPHGLGDDLVDIKARLLKAYRDMTKSGSYTAFMKSLGYCGTSRALEVTFSLSNGFHPHIHVLHFFEKEFSLDNQMFLWETLFSMWTKFLLKNEFKTPSREAFGCQKIASDKKTIADVAEYFSKVESDVNDDDIHGYLKKHQDVRGVTNSQGRTITGWQTEHEMTKWHLKKAKQDGENYRYSMFDFIRGYSIAKTNGDKETAARFRALWLAYRTAFKGARQLVTKHKHFKISELDLTDEQLGEQQPEDNQSKLVSQISFDDWRVVVFMNARGALLEKARSQGSEGVESLLSIIMKCYVDFFPDNPVHHSKYDYHFDCDLSFYAPYCRTEEEYRLFYETQLHLFMISLLWISE